MERVAVVGLGYVGLPLAIRLAQSFPGVIGFDIDEQHVAALEAGIDKRGIGADLESADITYTTNPADLAQATDIIVAVPTPVDHYGEPDLTAVLDATMFVGQNMRPGTLVAYESTVYPGCTEGRCVPLLESLSGLKEGRDFHVAYSPERINPGDTVHGVDKIVKIVAGTDEAALERAAKLYETVTSGGVHKAPSIKAAEAAKLLENLQRDVNIAVVNEFAIALHQAGLSIWEVLELTRTKWNALPFVPGLVGGHCVAVDPHYYIYWAREIGTAASVSSAARSTNAGIVDHLAHRIVEFANRPGRSVASTTVAIYGLAYKPNVADLRNSGAIDLALNLAQHGFEVHANEPMTQAILPESIHLHDLESMPACDMTILTVPHRPYLDLDWPNRLKPGGVFFDIANALPAVVGVERWTL